MLTMKRRGGCGSLLLLPQCILERLLAISVVLVQVTMIYVVSIMFNIVYYMCYLPHMLCITGERANYAQMADAIHDAIHQGP